MTAQKTILSLALLLLFSHIKAQIRYFTFGGLYHIKENKIDTSKYSFDISIGLPSGLGIETIYRLNHNYKARFSFHYADLSISDYKLTFGAGAANNNAQSLLFDVKARLSHIDLSLDYYIYRKLRLFGGISYYPKNFLKIDGELASIIEYNDLKLNADDLGKGVLKIGFSTKVLPVIGLGYDKHLRNQKFKFLIDLGVQYKGDYRFKIDITEGALLKKNEENAAILDRNFNRIWFLKFWPQLQLKLCYSL